MSLWTETAELNGYTQGQRVEVQLRDNDDELLPWVPGTINGLDRNDRSLPYRVVMDGCESSSGRWVEPEQVRPLTADVRQLQYRITIPGAIGRAAREGTWTDLEVGFSSVTTASVSIPPCTTYQRLEIRNTLPHTDAEIVAELRKLGNSASQRVRDIIAGKF